MNNTVHIITEANAEVATGHFSEARVISERLSAENINVNILVNKDIPQPLLDTLECSFAYYDDITECIDIVKGYPLVITDLRRVDNEFIKALKKHSDKTKVLCIDELGFMRLDCDIIINPLIDPYYHTYELPKATKLFAGAEYMLMKPQFSKLAKKSRELSKAIESITICMGGADTPGTTMRVLEGLNDFHGCINVVVGGGFKHNDALEKLKRSNINIYQNIQNIYDIFINTDLAFCSGGNVLYELACLGTPAVTVYTNPHEKRSADCFALRGFGKCICQANELNPQNVKEVIDSFQSLDTRHSHMIAGKELIDGLAPERIWNIIQTSLSLDTKGHL